ncbi:MAG: SAM hydrolase/SAM-dependent halogenase family protein [Gemmatimonadales bacterium]
MSIITLLTDFGTADSYVAEVKGVLLQRVPGVTVVDVSHDVAPGDIRAGQYVLSRAWHRFGAGTVHLVVVDPAVGTDRRALAAFAGGHWFVAPDNGLLSVLPEGARRVALRIPPDASPTFHARDVFAPVAARLATGSSLEELGPSVTDPVHLPIPTPRVAGTGVVGEVIHVDRFGNLVSNIPGALVGPGAHLVVGGAEVGTLRRTFGEVERGALLAYVGSGGTVEIAVRDGSAARRLEVGVGAEVRG